MERTYSTTRDGFESGHLSCYSRADKTTNSLLIQATDSVKLQVQKAVRERDQANQNAMHIRSDFEKLLLQSSQVSE